MFSQCFCYSTQLLKSTGIGIPIPNIQSFDPIIPLRDFTLPVGVDAVGCVEEKFSENIGKINFSTSNINFHLTSKIIESHKT